MALHSCTPMSTGRHPHDPPHRSAAYLPHLGATAVFAIVVACGGGNEGKPITSSEKPLPASKDSSVAKAEEGGDVKAEGGEAKTAGDEAKAEGGEAKADGGESKAADDGKAADDTGGAAPADPAALQTEIKNKKTTDERALAALAELETGGAKLRDVAKAGLVAEGDPWTAQYNPPWTPGFMRRNEVLVAVREGG